LAVYNAFFFLLHFFQLKLLTAEDVSLFLSSRYGIKNAPTKEMLESFCLTDKVVVSNGKGDTVPHLQLAEVASMLLVPFLIKSRQSLTSDVGPDVSGIESQEVRPYSGSTKDRKKTDEHKLELTMDRSTSDTIARCMMWTLTQGSVDWTYPHGETMPVGILTQDSMRSILEKFGLPHLAADTKLVQEMVQCLRDGPGDQVTLDVKKFIKALTHDVLLFDVSRELEDTTNYYDVFHTPRMVMPGSAVFKTPYETVKKMSDWSKKTSCVDSSIDEEAFCRIHELEKNSCNTFSNNGNQTYSENATKSWTFSCIDNSADTMRTKFLKFILLFGFLAAINSQKNLIDFWAEEVISTCKQNGHMNAAQRVICEVGYSILTYFVRGLVMGLVGWVYVGLGSLGNSVHERNVIPICISILVILGFNLYFLTMGQQSMTKEGLLIPPKVVEEIQASVQKRDPFATNLVVDFSFVLRYCISILASIWKDQTNYAVFVFHYLSVALGFLAILVQLFSLLRILLLRKVGKQENYDSILFRHQIVSAEAKSKRASSTKINLLVENARELYNLGELINDPDIDVRRRGMKIFRTVLNENTTKIEHFNVFRALKEVYSGESILMIFTLTFLYLVPLIISCLVSKSCVKRESS